MSFKLYSFIKNRFVNKTSINAITKRLILFFLSFNKGDYFKKIQSYKTKKSPSHRCKGDFYDLELLRNIARGNTKNYFAILLVETRAMAIAMAIKNSKLITHSS